MMKNILKVQICFILLFGVIEGSGLVRRSNNPYGDSRIFQAYITLAEDLKNLESMCDVIKKEAEDLKSLRQKWNESQKEVSSLKNIIVLMSQENQKVNMAFLQKIRIIEDMESQKNKALAVLRKFQSANAKGINERVALQEQHKKELDKLQDRYDLLAYENSVLQFKISGLEAKQGK